MKKTVFLVVTLLMCAAVYAAPTYSDSLKWGDGLYATGPWANQNSYFSWDVSQKSYQGSTYWFYDYTFSVPRKDISHLILETSKNIGPNDVFGVDAEQLYLLTGAKQYSPSDPGNSNPNLPGDIFGLKFDLNEDSKEFSFSFYSTRVPMLGDFYAKDGKDGGTDVVAWNTGFGQHPNIALGEAAQYGKIIVPDTVTIVPAPAAVLLAGLGTAVVGWLRRRRSL